MSTDYDAQGGVYLPQRFNEASKRLALHELVDELVAIMTEVDAADGEVTAQQDARLAALDLTLEQKVEAYAAVYERLGAEAAALKDLATRYRVKSQSRENDAERLRARLHVEMQRAGRDVVKTATASARIQNSPDKLELEEDDDAALLARYPGADEFFVTTRKLDRKALIDAIKSGRDFSYAWLQKSTHLRFR